MQRYQDVYKLAQNKAIEVTANPEAWKAFLNTSAYTYRNLFLNQLLIYAQRPDTKGCASMHYWNTVAKRWIHKGTRAIAVLDAKSDSPKLQLLFDMADTYPIRESEPPSSEALPWNISQQNQALVLQAIQQQNQAQSPLEGLQKQVQKYWMQRRAMFRHALEQHIAGSSLEWAEQNQQLQTLEQIVLQSSVYMACVRCGLSVDELDYTALEHLADFDTFAMAICLGSAVQQVSSQVLTELGRVVRQIDSVAKLKKTDNNKAIDEQTQGEVLQNATDIQHNRRIPSSQLEGGRDEPAAEPIRQNVSGVSAREPADAVRAEELLCPRCNAPLVQRTSRKKEHAGNSFYGCSNFPKCRYIKPIADSTAEDN